MWRTSQCSVTTYQGHIMKYIRILSWAMTFLGILLIAATPTLDLSPTWLLTGVLLTWAGIVKIIVVLIWTYLARLGTDEHQPEDAI